MLPHPRKTDEPMSQHWYVVQVKQHQETLSEAVLRQKGLEAYVPRMLQWPPPAVGSDVVPLFPGYVFAYAALPENYYDVARAIGVKHFVTFGEEPAMLPDAVIASLRAQQDADGRIRVSRLRHCNGVVRVTRGPFRGLLAVVENRLTSRERVVVLLDFLQRQTRVELPERWLRLA